MSKPTTSSRRMLAPNVVALWPDDRPPVVNPERRGRFPGNVQRLQLRLGLQAGAVAQLKGPPGSPNHGAVVRLLEQDDAGDWNIEGVHAPLRRAGGGCDLTAWVPSHRLHVFTDQRTVLRRLRAGSGAAAVSSGATPAWWPFCRLDFGRLQRLTSKELLRFEGACLYLAGQAGFTLWRAGRCLNRPAPASDVGDHGAERTSADSAAAAGWPFGMMDLELVLMLPPADLARLEDTWVESAGNAMSLDVAAPERAAL